MKSFYLTTPIYYVNDLPHIGHIYTTVVADVMARYQRMCGRPVHLLTGTDEHGQKIQRAAEARGIAPIELADEVVARYHELWPKLGVSHDDFIRTTEERHRQGVEEIIRRIADSGDFYTDHHEGWYCTACETFYTEKELVAPAAPADAGDAKLCPDHGTPTEWTSEANVFFRLSAYGDKLLEWYDRDQPVQPQTRANEVRSFVESGLRDLSVSRANLDWGIPFPDVDGAEAGQATYVWLDALTNYISALGFGQTGQKGQDDDALYERFWSGDGDRIHLVGKDILRHHAVYWPAFLMSAGLPLPTRIHAHGWWMMDDRKVSKSAGKVARPDHLVEEFGADPLRYFLLRDMVFGQDASYSDEAFVERYNSDLANDLGNTVSRVVTLARRAFDGQTPPRPDGTGRVAAAAEEAIRSYRDSMDEAAFSRALEALSRLLSETNSYLVDNAPWKAMKDEARLDEVGEVLWNALEAVRVVATALLPVMPTVARQVLAAIGAPLEGTETPNLDDLEWSGAGAVPSGGELPEAEGLFPRIDKDKYLKELTDMSDSSEAAVSNPEETEKTEQAPEAAPAAPADPQISIDQFFETVLKVGTVKAAEKIPKSSKLLKLTIDLGEASPRTVVAGIAKGYAPEDLVGRQVVVVANLKPAKLMGVESQGMVLAASDGKLPILVHPDQEVAPGTQVK